MNRLRTGVLDRLRAMRMEGNAIGNDSTKRSLALEVLTGVKSGPGGAQTDALLELAVMKLEAEDKGKLTTLFLAVWKDDGMWRSTNPFDSHVEAERYINKHLPRKGWTDVQVLAIEVIEVPKMEWRDVTQAVTR